MTVVASRVNKESYEFNGSIGGSGSHEYVPSLLQAVLTTLIATDDFNELP